MQLTVDDDWMESESKIVEVERIVKEILRRGVVDDERVIVSHREDILEWMDKLMKDFLI